MTALRNDLLQAAILAYIQGKAAITAEVAATNMKEDQWQGEGFTYPNIRIRMISLVPGSDGCSYTFSASLMVFTEDASSQNADRIAGIINETLHNKRVESNSIGIYFRTTNLIPAVRSDTNTWRSEVLMSGIAG